MSTTTRRIGTATVVGLLALVGAAGCGGAETPTATPTTPSAPSTPTPTPSPTPEPGLTGPTVVVVRELSDDSRVLVAYDLDDGTTRELATLERTDTSPTVDADGSSVVVARYPVPPNETEPAEADHRVTSHLVLIDLITGEHRALTVRKEGVAAEYPQWNRAGDGWVYFQRSDYGAHTTGLWRVDPGTGDAEEVPNGAGVVRGRYALEPDGRHVRADNPNWTDDTGAQHAGFAWRLDVTTGSTSLDPFDTSDARWWIADVAWTPDGAWFAHTRNEGALPFAAELLSARWPDGTPRALLTQEGSAATRHLAGQVGWHPDGSIVVLQDAQFSWDEPDHPEGAEPDQVEQRILLVDAADGSTTPIGPASVDDLSFDVWAPEAD